MKLPNTPDLIRPDLETLFLSPGLPDDTGTLAPEGHGSDRFRAEPLLGCSTLSRPGGLDDDNDGHVRDLPLSFHWAAATAPSWAATLGLPPLSPKREEARDAILLEAILAHNWDYPGVSYGRRRAFYTNKQRYHGPAFTFATVLPLVDDLGCRGLLECWIAPSGSAGGVQSTFRASPQLLQTVSSMPPADIVQVPRELVRLRDSNKRWLDYPDNGHTDRMRQILAEQNEAVQAASVGFPGVDMADPYQAIRADGATLYPKRKALYRVFNNDFGRGGRIYGGWWQCAPKVARQQMTIDGEPVIELDHPQLHPRLLYGRSGRRLEGDAYTLPGWERNDVKVAFNVLVNASSYQEAVGAIAGKLEGDNPRRRAAQLIASLKDRHGAIAEWFHSGVGVKLQAIDADMAEMVLVRLLKQNVVVLPIHDSFLVQQRHQGILQEAMDASYERFAAKS